MKWQCIVYGKKLTADHKPDACPLCGVTANYIVAEEDYVRPGDTLSSAAIADYDRALALEVEATRQYNVASDRARKEGDSLTGLFFEALA